MASQNKGIASFPNNKEDVINKSILWKQTQRRWADEQSEVLTKLREESRKQMTIAKEAELFLNSKESTW